MPLDLGDKTIVVGRTSSQLKRYGEKATGYIGKVVVSGGDDPVLGKKVLMDLSRSHVAIVCGKRGGGKCVCENTLITLADGTEKTIKELKNSTKKIATLTNDLKIETKNIDKFYSRKCQKILKIKLRTGKELELTPEHPLLTINGWVPIKDLNVNSRIATPRSLDLFGKSDDKKETIKILAYLLAEGHLRNSFILFTNKDEEIQSEFKKCVKKFDSNLSLKNHPKYTFKVVDDNIKRTITKNIRNNGKFSKNIEFDKKNKLRKFLEKLELYNKYSIEREIPELIFKQKKENIALFLNRLFSCDGYIYFNKDRGSITYSSSSKIMIKQVQSLLLRFGIISIFRKKKTLKHDNYELKILPKFNYIFKKEIGLYGAKKNKLKNIKDSKNRNPNVDTIPKEIWKILKINDWKKLGQGFNYKVPNLFKASTKYSPSRQKLEKIGNILKDKEILKIARSDIFWDEIIDIKEIKGNFTVYDLTIPKTHNFIANNIIIHNSYTMSVLIEEFCKQPFEIKERLSVIVIDTVGIFWSMKYANKEDEKLLEKWDLKPEGVEIRNLVPFGKKEFYVEKNLPHDGYFSIKTSQMEIEDWLATFKLNWKDPESALLSNTLEIIRSKVGNIFDIDDIINVAKKNTEHTKDTINALNNRLGVAKSWGLFSKQGTTTKEFARPATITVIDVSTYKTSIGMESIQELIVGLLGKKIYEERMLYRKEEEINLLNGKEKASEMPIVWMMIDEAHMFMPRDRQSIAQDVLLNWIRVGRQPGLSLLLATQRPNKLHSEAISQCDFFLSMRMTAQDDIAAVSSIRPSYLNVPMDKFYAQMPKTKGFAILIDDNSEKVMLLKIRPRLTWDGGKTANVFLD